MQVTPHLYVMHIDDGAEFHPGGSNNYFVGDPHEGMVLIDTGDQQRVWTQSILEYYERLGRPRITAILLTHGHSASSRRATKSTTSAFTSRPSASCSPATAS